MNFREAVKMIHPDINPGITKAGEKMNTLIIHKKNPRKIYMWMNKWGLVGVNKEQERQWMKVSTLSKNTFYGGLAAVRLKNSKVYHVLKTTKKRSYFVGNTDNKKYCHVNTITNAWILREAV